MLIDVTSNTKIHCDPAFLPHAVSWDGSKWVVIGGGYIRFIIDTTELVGERPECFYATITTNAPINNSYFYLLLDGDNEYQWDTPILYPAEQSVGVGQYTVGIDLFYSGLNSHLGDITIIEFADVGSISSIDAIFFSDYIPPVSAVPLWKSYINVTEVLE